MKLDNIKVLFETKGLAETVNTRLSEQPGINYNNR